MIPYGVSPSAVWRWDSANGVYVDLTRSVIRLRDSVVALEAVADFLYVGYERRFDSFMGWLTHPGRTTGMKWECSVEGGWEEIIPIQPLDWELDSG